MIIHTVLSSLQDVCFQLTEKVHRAEQIFRFVRNLFSLSSGQLKQ